MKRHPFDLTSFIFGAIFGGAAAVYLLADQLAWDVNGRWVLPVALILLGIAGIAGAVGGLRSSSPDADEAEVESTADELAPDSVS
jgi:H+/Cl- antiporter ClcA